MDAQLKTTLLKLCLAVEQVSSSDPGAARHLIADARRLIAAAAARCAESSECIAPLRSRAPGSAPRTRAAKSSAKPRSAPLQKRSSKTRSAKTKAKSKRTPRSASFKRSAKTRSARSR